MREHSSVLLEAPSLLQSIPSNSVWLEKFKEEYKKFLQMPKTDFFYYLAGNFFQAAKYAELPIKLSKAVSIALGRLMFKVLAFSENPTEEDRENLTDAIFNNGVSREIATQFVEKNVTGVTSLRINFVLMLTTSLTGYSDFIRSISQFLALLLSQFFYDHQDFLINSRLLLNINAILVMPVEQVYHLVFNWLSMLSTLARLEADLEAPLQTLYQAALFIQEQPEETALTQWRLQDQYLQNTSICVDLSAHSPFVYANMTTWRWQVPSADSARALEGFYRRLPNSEAESLSVAKIQQIIKIDPTLLALEEICIFLVRLHVLKIKSVETSSVRVSDIDEVMQSLLEKIFERGVQSLASIEYLQFLYLSINFYSRETYCKVLSQEEFHQLLRMIISNFENIFEFFLGGETFKPFLNYTTALALHLNYPLPPLLKALDQLYKVFQVDLFDISDDAKKIQKIAKMAGIFLYWLMHEKKLPIKKATLNANLTVEFSESIDSNVLKIILDWMKTLGIEYSYEEQDRALKITPPFPEIRMSLVVQRIPSSAYHLTVEALQQPLDMTRFNPYANDAISVLSALTEKSFSTSSAILLKFINGRDQFEPEKSFKLANLILKIDSKPEIRKLLFLMLMQRTNFWPQRASVEEIKYAFERVAPESFVEVFIYSLCLFKDFDQVKKINSSDFEKLLGYMEQLKTTIDVYEKQQKFYLDLFSYLKKRQVFLRDLKLNLEGEKKNLLKLLNFLGKYIPSREIKLSSTELAWRGFSKLAAVLGFFTLEDAEKLQLISVLAPVLIHFGKELEKILTFVSLKTLANSLARSISDKAIQLEALYCLNIKAQQAETSSLLKEKKIKPQQPQPVKKKKKTKKEAKKKDFSSDQVSKQETAESPQKQAAASVREPVVSEISPKELPQCSLMRGIFFSVEEIDHFIRFYQDAFNTIDSKLLAFMLNKIFGAFVTSPSLLLAYVKKILAEITLPTSNVVFFAVYKKIRFFMQSFPELEPFPKNVFNELFVYALLLKTCTEIQLSPDEKNILSILREHVGRLIALDQQDIDIWHFKKELESMKQLSRTEYGVRIFCKQYFAGNLPFDVFITNVHTLLMLASYFEAIHKTKLIALDTPQQENANAKTLHELIRIYRVIYNQCEKIQSNMKKREMAESKYRERTFLFRGYYLGWCYQHNQFYEYYRRSHNLRGHSWVSQAQTLLSVCYGQLLSEIKSEWETVSQQVQQAIEESKMEIHSQLKDGEFGLERSSRLHRL